MGLIRSDDMKRTRGRVASQPLAVAGSQPIPSGDDAAVQGSVTVLMVSDEEENQ
jgi:hypothetical protein